MSYTVDDVLRARSTVRRFLHRHVPAPACTHAWSRWFGLIWHWRSCENCRMVEAYHS
ncbi:MAG: hypothetical protein ACHQC8_02575 [Solirubrobacterales bacterium]